MHNKQQDNKQLTVGLPSVGNYSRLESPRWGRRADNTVASTTEYLVIVYPPMVKRAEPQKKPCTDTP